MLDHAVLSGDVHVVPQNHELQLVGASDLHGATGWRGGVEHVTREVEVAIAVVIGLAQHDFPLEGCPNRRRNGGRSIRGDREMDSDTPPVDQELLEQLQDCRLVHRTLVLGLEGTQAVNEHENSRLALVTRNAPVLRQGGCFGRRVPHRA